MAVEVWMPIKGREREYEISSLGRVRSLARFRAGKNGSLIRVNERILKQSFMGSGYPSVSLGSHRTAFVHRLVAFAFVENHCDFDEVNHKDGDNRNNSAENLEWVSRTGNMQPASRMGLLATGSRHGRHTTPEAFNGR